MGNPVEKSVFAYLKNSGVNVQELISQRDSNEPIFTIPFNSMRKRETRVFKINDGKTVRVAMRGALEIILNRVCTTYVAGGQKLALDENAREIFMQKDDTCRNIGYAYKDYDIAAWEVLSAEKNDFASEDDKESVETDMTMLARIGLQTKIKNYARSAIATYQNAGVTVRLVTGDNSVNALHIAQDAGIHPTASYEEIMQR